MYEALAAAGSFVSARDLHDSLRAAGQRIGFTTVYRALRALAANGGAHVISGRDGRAAYRACGAGHHHHLICLRCGRTDEVAGGGLERWAAGVALAYGFADVTHVADVFGTCPGCRLAAGGAEAEHVEAVAVGVESVGCGELADGLGGVVLEPFRERDVDDRAAVDA